MTKTAYTCQNRRCRDEVSQPGRCDVCASMWERTLEIARAQYAQEDEDEEDDMSYGCYDDQEDFGADMGISVSDPLDYYYD